MSCHAALVLAFALAASVCAIPVDETPVRSDTIGLPKTPSAERRGVVDLAQLTALENVELSRIDGTPGDNHPVLIELSSDNIGQDSASSKNDSWLVD